MKSENCKSLIGHQQRADPAHWIGQVIKEEKKCSSVSSVHILQQASNSLRTKSI